MHETGEIITLPLLNIHLKNGRKEVLQIINTLSSKEESISGIDIANKSNLKKSAVYANLKELVRMGFVDKENKLTVFGKICLLNWTYLPLLNNKIFKKTWLFLYKTNLI